MFDLVSDLIGVVRHEHRQPGESVSDRWALYASMRGRTKHQSSRSNALASDGPKLSAARIAFRIRPPKK